MIIQTEERPTLAAQSSFRSALSSTIVDTARKRTLVSHYFTILGWLNALPVLLYCDKKTNVVRLYIVTRVETANTPIKTRNKTGIPKYLVIYPDVIGKTTRANDPADANQPNNVPWGLLPTTTVRFDDVDDVPKLVTKLATEGNVKVQRDTSQRQQQQPKKKGQTRNAASNNLLFENNPITAVWPMG